MIRIVEISPKPDDSTSYYRSRGALTRLQKEYSDIEVIPIQGDGIFEFRVTWADLALGDILFLSRPASEDMLKLVKLANKMNMPVWVDYDDLLIAIPKWNRTKTYYDQPDVRAVIEQILTMAQMVTVTTPLLATRLSIFNDNIHIVPNAIDDYMFPEPVEYSNNKLVVWRGGDTHVNDLYVHREGINKMMAEFEDYEFIFLGYDAPFLDSPKNKSVIPPTDIFSYFKFLRTTNASYNIIPLQDNDFNVAKSNISWLETHYAGGYSIAPYFGVNGEVYGDNVYPYELQHSTTALYDSFCKLVKIDSSQRMKIWSDGIIEIKEKYILSITNKQRYELIKDLMEQFK